MRFDDAASGGHEEGEREIGRGVAENAGCVGYPYSRSVAAATSILS
jgi:hypothetical protein